MNVVDSLVWLGYFADGPNGGFFAPDIEATFLHHLSSMKLGPRTFWYVGVLLLATSIFCKREPGGAKESNLEKVRIVDIIPGESIGEARLGIKVGELPSRAVINRPSGALDDIRLLINEAGVVEDICLEPTPRLIHWNRNPLPG